jgi:hypothetical protein
MHPLGLDVQEIKDVENGCRFTSHDGKDCNDGLFARIT